MGHTILILIFLWVLGLPCVAFAEIIHAKMPNGYTSTAEFRETKSNLPTVMLIHGFLATRNFQTVSRLSNALYDEGFSVLAPTLSLNVNNRKVSLACEAIHTHTLDNDTVEIKYWIDWLNKRGKNNLVLIGHSFGSINILSYALKHHHPSVKKMIATSLVVDEHTIDKKIIKAQINTARSLVKKGEKKLDKYKISYCQKFTSPPEAYLSYATWTKNKIIKALNGVSVPVEVILGANDNRIIKQWPATLRKNGVNLTMVSGANHFFDAEHEFDLLESVLKSLKQSHKN